MAHPPSTRLALALTAALATAAALGLVTASAADHEPPTKPASNLSGPLVVLLEAFEEAPADYATALADASSPSAAYLASGIVRITGDGVQTYINVADIDDALHAALTALGVVIERESEDGSIVQAHVPLGVLAQVADLAGVLSVTPPVYGFSDVVTEGDSILGFDTLRAAQGADGSGVTVGVISDGIAGLLSAVGSGDLPATSETRVGGKLTATSGGVISTSFRADGDLEAGLDGGVGAEGTAILEIVHDIAPGAQLRFANFSTSVEFMAAVDFLASVSDVVIDDIGFFARPTDQSSDVSTNTAAELANLANPIRAYATSAGNHALRHYEETYVDSGVDGAPFTDVAGGLHEFKSTAKTTDAQGLGTRPANQVAVAPGGTIVIRLTWDDDFGAATSDYDLFLREFPVGPVVAVGGDDNHATTGTGDPSEVIAFTNTLGVTKTYDVFVQNFLNASATHVLEMFVQSGGLPFAGGARFNFNTVAGSVPAQSDSGGGVLSVGAIDAGDPGHNTIEPFSSQGPAGGALKPDVTAIDGVAVTGAGGFGSPFFGTSAAAPHVAGLAALLLQMRPDLLAGEAGDDPTADRAALRTAITDTAVDLGSFGDDNTFGHGRVDGASAGVALQVAPIVTVGADLAVLEGATVSLDVTFSDLNVLDALTAAIDWGDGTVAAGTADQVLSTGTSSHAYADDGVFVATATVTDDKALFGGDSMTVTVGNATPVVDAVPNISLPLSATLNALLATFTDAGAADTHVASIDWGDGTPLATGTLDQSLGTVSGSYTYATDGLFTVTVTVTDDDGGVGSDTLIVDVQDAPVVSAGGDQAATEGSSVTLSATFVDAASDTHTASIDWGDGSPVEAGNVDQGPDTVGGSHVYADNGVFTVTLTVTDAAALTGVDSLDVTVGNATPVVDAAPNTAVFFDGPIEFAVASFTDAGSTDTHTATIDWGDGDVSAGTVDQDAGTVAGTHQYLLFSSGTVTRTVTVTITDDDGAVASDTFTVDVVSPPPVPGTTTWALVALGVLLAGAALASRLRRRQPAGAP